MMNDELPTYRRDGKKANLGTGIYQAPMLLFTTDACSNPLPGTQVANDLEVYVLIQPYPRGKMTPGAGRDSLLRTHLGRHTYIYVSVHMPRVVNRPTCWLIA
jgi:hypothetical protein